MNYRLIGNRKELERWVDFLPNLLPDERYFISLFARKKYQSDLKSNDNWLDKRIVRKQHIIRTIERWQIAEDSYTTKDVQVKSEGLVVYMNPTPRDLRKATFRSFAKLGEKVGSTTPFNPVQEMYKLVQKTKGTRKWISFDFDLDSDRDVLYTKEEIDYLTNHSASYINTRGGIHALVDPTGCPRTWYKDLMDLGADQVSDILSPIPGTLQGGHLVTFEE